jgi:hypothetical protein
MRQPFGFNGKSDSSRQANPGMELPKQFSAGRPVHRSEAVKGLARNQILIIYSQPVYSKGRE